MISEIRTQETLFNNVGPWHSATIGKTLPNYNREVIVWCVERFGKSGFHCWVYSQSMETFFFKDEKHLTMFVLRWS